MQLLMETGEKAHVEKELQELMETTIRLELELHAVLSQKN